MKSCCGIMESITMKLAKKNTISKLVIVKMQNFRLCYTSKSLKIFSRGTIKLQ